MIHDTYGEKRGENTSEIFIHFSKKTMNYNNFSCAGLFIFDVTEQFVLLGMDGQTHLSPQKGGVKGGVESKKDTSLYDCAIRETFEESGIVPNDLLFSQKEYIEFAPSGKPNILYWMAKLTKTREEFSFDPTELLSVKWYHAKTLLELNPVSLKKQRLAILNEMVQDIGMSLWSSEIDEKRILNNHNLKLKPKKNIHENESRFIVEALRHKLDSKELSNHDEQGYVKFVDLMIYYMANKKKKIKNLTMQMMVEIAAYDKDFDKHRLDLQWEDNNWKVRANQGHTSGKNVKASEIYQEIVEPLKYCIHGTEQKFIDSIFKTGLSKMTRTHIHCITGDPNNKETFKEVLSGFKKTSNCILIIDMAATMTDGLKWYQSKNGVILTEGPIDSKYFTVQNLWNW